MRRKSDEKTYSYRLWKNVYSTNQLEIKRDKIISIKEVIDTIADLCDSGISKDDILNHLKNIKN